MRDPLASLIAFNRGFVGGGRDPDWLQLKLARLCASPFGFLRGTFHLFAADWPLLGDDPLAPAPPSPVVGDLHLENFGAYRAADGRFVFDVNDFDETALATPALDLARLATSFLLAAEADRDDLGRIDALLEAYRAAVHDGDLSPVGGKGMPPAVKALLAEAEDGSRSRWLERRVEGDADRRRFRRNEKYQPVEDPALRTAVIEAVRRFGAGVAAPADCSTWPEPIDVAVRVAGTGSLGRFRWAVLMPGKGDKVGKELLLELKEARPSSLDPGGTAAAQAARVIAHVRTLQGDPPLHLGDARVGTLPVTLRELQPTEAKLAAATLRPATLDEVAVACGTVLGRLHHRGAADLPARLHGRDRTIHRRIAAFALRYADMVTHDHALLVAHRAEVERALGLT